MTKEVFVRTSSARPRASNDHIAANVAGSANVRIVFVP